MTTSAIIHRQAHSVTHHIAEDKAGMGEFEVFEEAVEFAAVQGAPGTVKIISRLRLLPGVVVVQELNKDQSHHSHSQTRERREELLSHCCTETLRNQCLDKSKR